MIYGRFGIKVKTIRHATWKDVEKLTEAKRGKPDKQDREAFDNGSYVVVTFEDDEQTERLYHQAFLRADDGISEICRALGEQ